MQNSQLVIWLDGQYVPWAEANMHVLSHHYGIGVFEGLRAYETPNGVSIFRLQAHTDRLFRSAHILNIKIPYSKETLNTVQCEIIKKSKLKNAYLRPIVFHGGEYLGLLTHTLSIHVAIAAVEWKGAYESKNGIKVKTSSFIRSHPNSIFCKAKANGNYMNSVLAAQEARACGADDALLLDHHGCVTEGSGANFFMVRDGILYTPEITYVLEGITRETILLFAKDLGLVVCERRITRDEVYIADEAFFTGTAVEITPIIEIDGRLIGKGKMGPITSCLQQLYTTAVNGEDGKYNKWSTFVDSSPEMVVVE